MKNHRIHSLLTVSVIGLLSGGCASKNVLFFGTDTSLGLNVSGTTQAPNKIAFDYERSEIAFVPRNPKGEAHSVLGALDADIAFWGEKTIYQVFATGQAAENYANKKAGKKPEYPSSTHDDVKSESNQSLVFMTHTAAGLKFAAGEGAVAPNLLLGFRRGEAALVPVKDTDAKVRSVFGEISYSTRTHSNSPAPAGTVSVPGTIDGGGVRIKQVFATGKAAEIYAQSDVGAAKLDAGIGLASVPVVTIGPLNAIQAPKTAYEKAKSANDTVALAAFDEAAKAVDTKFTDGGNFIALAESVEQVQRFEAMTKADVRSGKYYE